MADYSLHSPKVNLNAAPQHSDDLDAGVSLAWLLVKNAQWELLMGLAGDTPDLNLNAAPLNQMHMDKGISVALLLTHNEQWGVTKRFRAAPSCD